mmetsp:Transcript_15641/g.11018  ORF Transcript_15641/g.11018 Transcript_15641/m.11018 type:complete len:116 (-) Transcript_15641:104-451(-)
MVNLVVKYDPASPTKDGYLKCLGVATGLFAMITLSGPYSGACLNTAVAFAQTAYVVTQDGNPDSIYSHYLPIYVFAPIVGATVAGFVFRLHIKAIEKFGVEDSRIHNRSDKLLDG